jgi:hypothetical protein
LSRRRALSTRSDDFRVRWANHNVKIHTTGDLSEGEDEIEEQL